LECEIVKKCAKIYMRRVHGFPFFEKKDDWYDMVDVISVIPSMLGAHYSSNFSNKQFLTINYSNL